MSWLDYFEDNRTPLEKYMDDLNYFEKRVLITDSLHNRSITAPFTKKEIIEYAYKEASEGMFNASYNAINGYENDVYFIGKPEIDPLTNQENSQEEQKGVLTDTIETVKNASTFAKAVPFIILGAIVYRIIK
jgi:hypothetical protein